MKRKHPMQPLDLVDGVIRFRENKIVRFLAEGRLNEIAEMDFSPEDRMQLAQLIGYSLSGYGDLSYVTDKDYAKAEERSSKLQNQPA